MRKLLLAILVMLTFNTLSAQSKIFKQVAGAIRTEINEIVENKSVIGYTSLTQLEKTDKDYYNYELTIMDENLNDIGNVKFNDLNMDLTSVAFEQDVLCLTFFKSKIKNNIFRGFTKDYVSIYFVDLKGNIINKIEEEAPTYRAIYTLNIPEKGFMVLFNTGVNKIDVYDTKGKRSWGKDFDEASAYYIATSKDLVSFYHSKNRTFEFLDASNGKKSYTFEPSIPSKYRMVVLDSKSIDGRIIYTGRVSTKKPAEIMKQMKKGRDKGVFTLEASGLSKNQIKERVALWADGSTDVLKKNSSLPENKKEQVIISSSLIDQNGNAYFYGTNFNRSLRVGYTATAVALSPTIFIPLYMSMLGFNKYYYQNGTIFKMDSKGILSTYGTIETEKSRKMIPKTYWDWAYSPTTSFSNADATENFFITYDKKQYYLYNVGKRKEKTIPIKEGGITTSIFPAKEGHIMVVERNKNEKSTKLSIVAL